MSCGSDNEFSVVEPISGHSPAWSASTEVGNDRRCHPRSLLTPHLVKRSHRDVTEARSHGVGAGIPRTNLVFDRKALSGAGMCDTGSATQLSARFVIRVQVQPSAALMLLTLSGSAA